MTAQHTPGPWRVIFDDDGNPLSGRPSVVASDELDCGIVHWDGFVQPYWSSARGDKEIHANARPIAAAPELLEAAIKVRANMRNSVTGKESREAWSALSAAIKKATGGPA